MNNPEIWEKNKPHGAYVSALMEEYKEKFNWRADGRDSLIDIGCAGGSITMECILPIMPSNFDLLMGIDISKQMIDYAQKKYTQPKIQFKAFDIINGDANELPQVDHVSSVHVFHLLHDHEKALTNIYNLLKPGGDCFIMFLPSFAFYTVYEQIAGYPKWSKYIKSVNDTVIPTHSSKNPKSDFDQLLKKCSFTGVEIEIREKVYHLGHVNLLKNFIRTVDAFYNYIPLEEHDAFTTDFAQLAVDVFNSAAFKPSNESEIYIPAHALIAYAKKSC